MTSITKASPHEKVCLALGNNLASPHEKVCLALGNNLAVEVPLFKRPHKTAPERSTLDTAGAGFTLCLFLLPTTFELSHLPQKGYSGRIRVSGVQLSRSMVTSTSGSSPTSSSLHCTNYLPLSTHTNIRACTHTLK